MKYRVTLKNKTYEIEVERGTAILLDEYEAKAPVPPAIQTTSAAPVPAAAVTPSVASAPTASLAAGEPIASPMPGTILDIKVNVGDQVQSGQLVAILEAMKMENEIFAPRDGQVVQVAVSKGTAVDTGTPILILS